VPLYADRGRNGGQRTHQRPDKVVVSLSVAEVSALLIALAAGGPDLPFSSAGKTATEQLLDGLPDATRVGIDRLRTRIRTRPKPNAQPRIRMRRTLEEGVQHNLVANIRYCDRDGAMTNRAVDCVGFLHGSDGWYLIGWCHLRRAGRMFRLDRIDTARLTKQTAEERDVDDTLGWVPYQTALP
jgi:predicted DNA-binding transcriptional regulator YafY